MDQLDEKVIVTRRFVLRPLKTSDAGRMFDGLNDPASYAFTPDTPFPDVAALAERYARLERRRSPDLREVWLNWTIGAETTDQLFGYVQLTVKPVERRALVAYFVFPAHRRQGMAAEAVAAALKEAVDGFALSRVDAEIDTRNLASIRTIERLGFERVRVVPQADHFKGAASDEFHYSYTVLNG
ncbi:MAG: GNAT family N-acetyltransferase [Janthinobacterium lividum]